MSINYAATTGAGVAANSTAANAAVLGVYNPTAAPGGGSKIFEWEIGPAGNSADDTYSIRAKRATTLSTWATAITPSDIGPRGTTALTLVGATSTARGSAGANLGVWGFHMRGGYRWVSIPGGELQNDYTINHGIELEYSFAQSSDSMVATVFFSE